MNDPPGTLDQIAARLEALERRVSRLEHPAVREDAAAGPSVSPAPHQPQTTPSNLPILGRAMLGIAGAYLLRALEESGSAPRLAIACVALLYACAWLAAAARLRLRSGPAGAIYACTSALLLVPMLWELTLRFHLLPAAVTAAALAAYAALASLLASRRRDVVAIAHTAVAAASLALAVAAHNLLPFLAALLLLVALGEFGLLRGHISPLRIVVTLAADTGLWMFIYIYMAAPAARADYPPLGAAVLLVPGIALFVLTGAGTVLRTLAQHQPIAGFEIFQTTLACALAVWSVLALGSPASAFFLGCACTLLAAAGYAVVLRGVCAPAGSRTGRVYFAWSAALLLFGAWLCLPAQALAACLCPLAAAAVFAGARLRNAALQLHAMLFLAAAAAVSSLPVYAVHALLTTPSGIPPWSLFVIVIAAALCDALARSQPGPEGRRFALRLFCVLLLVVTLFAFAIDSLAALVALRFPLQAHHLAFIRTLSLCGAALLLAYSGARWRRVELTRVSYGVLTLLAAKLLFEDLRHGHFAFVAASICLFALALMAVPHIARPGSGAQTS